MVETLERMNCHKTGEKQNLRIKEYIAEGSTYTFNRNETIQCIGQVFATPVFTAIESERES